MPFIKEAQTNRNHRCHGAFDPIKVAVAEKALEEDKANRAAEVGHEASSNDKKDSDARKQAIQEGLELLIAVRDCW
jgi:hypothetical protein